MRKTGKYLLLAALALLAGMTVMTWRSGYGGLVRRAHHWLPVSGHAHCVARLKSIVRSWQQMWPGQVDPAHDVYLVIDIPRHAFWIEDRGQILEEYRGELPEQLAWKLYHEEGKGLTPLPDVARFKRRGVFKSQIRPERIWLIGQGGPNECLAFHFNCTAHHTYPAHNVRDVDVNRPDLLPRKGVDYYASIVVPDDEYEQARRTWVGAGTIGSSARPDLEPVDAQKAAWLKVEKKLYKTIESQVKEAGFRLNSLEVEPGPAWSAAHAHIGAIRGHPLQRLWGGRSQYAMVYLKIDSLGNGIWYANTAPYHLTGNGAVLELEFLVSEGKSLSREERARRLAQGRERQHPTAPPTSPWRVTLPNGAIVTILGVSKATAGERSWWGPDGSAATCVPEYYAESRFYDEPEPQDAQLARRYEVVWVVDWPLPSFGATVTSWTLWSRFNPTLLPSFARDRYGEEYRSSSDIDSISMDGSWDDRVIRRFYAAGVQCRSADTQTTPALSLRIDNGPAEWVTFRNVSLRPGEDPGFEIVLGKGDTP